MTDDDKENYMTVAELIEKLKQFDQSLPVCYYAGGPFAYIYDFDLCLCDEAIPTGSNFKESVLIQ